jgi:ribonuclease HI
VPRQKYYVVWKGRKRGVFTTWAECERQVKGFVEARYKAFGSRQEAERAFAGDYSRFQARSSSLGKWRTARLKPILPSVCVDAACDGSPGQLEYRGVLTDTGRQAFKEGPFQQGTNNVGEFLAIVEAFRWLDAQQLDRPVYSDSETAIAWVKAKKCNTKLARTRINERLFDRIGAAEKQLRDRHVDGGGFGQVHTVIKWDTATWGEIPADFGRK